MAALNVAGTELTILQSTDLIYHLSHGAKIIASSRYYSRIVISGQSHCGRVSLVGSLSYEEDDGK